MEFNENIDLDIEEMDFVNRDSENTEKFDGDIEPKIDDEKDIDEESSVQEDQEQEVCEASDPRIYPNSFECSLPERKLSRWILDFPRMFPDSGWTSLEHSYDGTVVFSGCGNIILISPEDEPTTFFPDNLKVEHAVEGEPGEWYASSFKPFLGGLFHFKEGTDHWRMVYENPIEGIHFADDIDVDSHGNVWSWSTGIFQNFIRWDGDTIKNIQAIGANENTIHNSSDRLFECGGHTYFFGGIEYEETPLMTAAIFRVTEEEDALEVIWQAPDEALKTTFYSATINPETCEFYAGGPNLHVEGVLSDPVTIQSYIPFDEVEIQLPMVAWKDWSTGIVYGSLDIYPNYPYNDGTSLFFIKRPGMEDFEGMEPTWPFTGFGGWAAYQMYGLGVDSLYAPGYLGHFKYDPQETRWDWVYRHPLLSEPSYHSNAYVRSLAVRTACDGRFRVHVTGFRLPVMRRTNCHDWEEAYPDSEGALALYDDGKEIWVVGEKPEVIHGIGNEWSSIQGPTPEWLEGRSVLNVNNGGLYALGIYDENGNDSRLFYLEEASTSTPQWAEVKGILSPERFKPVSLLSCNGKTYVQVNNMSYYEQSEIQLYSLQGPEAQFRIGFTGEGRFRVHEDRLFYCSEEGVREIFDEQGGITSVIIVPPVEHYGKDMNIQDAVQMPDGRWILASGPLEYDPATEEVTRYYAVGKHYSPGYNDYFYYIWNFEKDGSILELALLPTGEVLAAGMSGQILIRTTDEQWLGQ